LFDNANKVSWGYIVACNQVILYGQWLADNSICIEGGYYNSSCHQVLTWLRPPRLAR